VDRGQGSVSWSLLGLVELQPLGENGSLSGDEGSNTSLLFNSLDDAQNVALGNLEGWVGDIDQKNLAGASLLFDAVFVGSGNLNFFKFSLNLLLGLVGQIVENRSDFLFELGWFSFSLKVRCGTLTLIASLFGMIFLKSYILLFYMLN
jgi:hypothetical protein